MISIQLALFLQVAAGVAGWAACLLWKSVLVYKELGAEIKEKNEEIARLRRQVADTIGRGPFG